MLASNNAAITYLATGLHPLPVRPDKTPLVRWREYQDRAPTGAELKEWWLRWPAAQVALVTGVGIDVLDVEAQALAVLDSVALPPTPTCTTQGGGRHFYFRTGYLQTTTWTAEGRHLGDIKARGGYVVAPPSRGERGSYTWIPDRALGDVELAEPPEWVRAIAGRNTGMERRVTGTPAGRSESDQAIALRMVLQGAPDAEIATVLAAHETVRDRGRHGPEYVQRTISKARSYAESFVSVAVIEQVTLSPTCVFLRLHVDTGSYRDRVLRLPLDFPVTDRSETRWRCLLSAAGLSWPPDPDLLAGRRLRLEVLSRDGALRVGRFFVLDNSTNIVITERETQ